MRRLAEQRVFQKPDFSNINGAINFQEIFGVPSLERAIRLLIRLYRIKRIRGMGTAKDHWYLKDILAPEQDIFRGRRYHHLTPGRRGDMPYAGNAPGNLLLIRRRRHRLLHHWFGSRTLEEIILLILKLHKFGIALCRRLQEFYSQSCLTVRRERQRRRREEFLSTVFQKQLFCFGPGKLPGLLFFCWDGVENDIVKI